MTTPHERRALGFASAGALVAVTTGLLRLAWLPGLRLSTLASTVATAPVQSSLPLLLALGLCALSGWLLLTVSATAASRLPGASGRLAAAALHRVAPAALRRVAEVVLGATTVLAVTTGAAQAAAPAQRPPAAEQVSMATPWLAGLDRPATTPAAAPVPTTGTGITLDRPVGVPVADPARGLALVSGHATRATRNPAPQALSVTVRPGDSLWRIAARTLPAGSSQSAIEQAWHRWYAANRHVIGPDPGLLQPGQQLIAPQH